MASEQPDRPTGRGPSDRDPAHDEPRRARRRTPWDDPTVRTTLKVVLVLVATYLAWLALAALVHLLILLFLALLVAAAMYVPLLYLEERGMPRLLAIGLLYLGLLALAGLALFFIIPPLVEQAQELVADLPDYLNRASDWVDHFGIDGLTDELRSRASELSPDIGTLLNVPLTALGVFVDIAIVFASSLLMLLQRDTVGGWVLQFFSRDTGETLREVWTKSFSKLGAYVRGQLLLMSIIGGGTAVGMLIFGVPFALPMGLLGFVGEAIPNLGPVIAGAPVVLLGLSQSPTTALIMLGWLLLLQALENYVLTPLVQHEVMDIPPLVVFVAVLAGLALFGILGAIIAVPVVGVVDVILREIIIPLRRGELRRSGKA